MPFDPVLTLETAALMLAAFLLGATIGSLLRIGALRLKPAPVVAASPGSVPGTDAAVALVAAPVIAPLAVPREPLVPADIPVPDFAEATAAPSLPPKLAPARKPGVATSGRDVGRHDREASQVAPEAGSPHRADEEVLRIEPDILPTAAPPPELTAPSTEAADASDDIETTPASGDKSAQSTPSAALPAVDLTAEVLALAPVQSPPPAEPEVVASDLSAAYAEAAAMRAIEGSWTPGRRAPSAEAPAGLVVEAPAKLAVPTPVAPAEPSVPETAVDLAGDDTVPDLIVAEDDEDVVATSEVGSLAEIPDVLPQHEEDRILPAESSGESGPDAIELDLPPVRIGTSPAAQDQPPGLGAPRHGMRDDLTQIVGVLPVVETTLNRLGVYHFDQVAEWSDANANWVETHLGIAGRVEREHWREQAHELAAVTSGKRPHRKKRPS